MFFKLNKKAVIDYKHENQKNKSKKIREQI